jgi:predicted ATPase
MSFEPIRQLDIENYGCIKKASFALTPLHALIGPNDSGKSTTLRALRTLAQFAAGNFGPEPSHPRPFDPFIGSRPSESILAMKLSDAITYSVQIGDNRQEVVETVWANQTKGQAKRSCSNSGVLEVSAGISPAVRDAVHAMKAICTTATMVRFDPNALRKPTRQLLANEPIQFLDETGLGLASVYQAINSRDVDAFVAIRDQVKKFFPTIQNIRVPTVENNAVVLQVRLIDNTLVPAEALSEGLLYFLAFTALRHLAESRLFLIEEPENGLHPARIGEVMDTLREIAKTSQVIIATHSPLVVNELEGHEVSVVTRDPEQGTRAILLKDVPDFADASKVYRLGEFWVSYCDGNQEAPLLSEEPRS